MAPKWYTHDDNALQEWYGMVDLYIMSDDYQEALKSYKASVDSDVATAQFFMETYVFEELCREYYERLMHEVETQYE